MFCILPPPPPQAAIVHRGAFSGLLSSCDECSLIACIDSPSEALAWFLINPPSGCSVLSGHSAPYLLVKYNELVAKTCWYNIHIYWIWLSRVCPCMSNLLVLVARTILGYYVTVLLMATHLLISLARKSQPPPPPISADQVQEDSLPGNSQSWEGESWGRGQFLCLPGPGESGKWEHRAGGQERMMNLRTQF